MFIKSVVAAAAIAGAVALGSAGTANANPQVSVGIGFNLIDSGYNDGWDGGPGFYDGGYDDGPGSYDNGPSWRPPHRPRWDQPRPMSRGISCAQGRNIVASSGFRGVSAYSCSAPVYRYIAWKRGEQYRISVNFRGNIVSVRPVY